MIWNTVLITLFAVGAWAAVETDERVLNQVKNKWTELCKKNNAEDKIDEVQGKAIAFVECMKPFQELKNELVEALLNGNQDEVLKKFCAKINELKTCSHDMVEGITPCLEESRLSQIPIFLNVTDSMFDFACDLGGDWIGQILSHA